MQKETIKNRNGLDLVIVVNPQENQKGLVFIQHGLASNKEFSLVQTAQARFSEKGYTTVIFDATNGMGESGTDPEGITFTKHNNDLIDVIERSKKQPWFQEPFILAGHSLGGMSVIYYTENNPESVKLLLPMCPAISGEQSLANRKKASIEAYENWKKEGFYEERDGEKSMKVPFKFMEVMQNYDMRIHADRILCKMLLICGEKDFNAPWVDSKEFYDRVTAPKSLKIVEGCGHVPKTPEHLAAFDNYLKEFIEAETAE